MPLLWRESNKSKEQSFLDNWKDHVDDYLETDYSSIPLQTHFQLKDRKTNIHLTATGQINLGKDEDDDTIMTDVSATSKKDGQSSKKITKGGPSRGKQEVDDSSDNEDSEEEEEDDDDEESV